MSTIDISNLQINKPSDIESTALGAAFLAGIKSGFWQQNENILKNIKIDKTYKTKINNRTRKKLINGWNESIQTIINK